MTKLADRLAKDLVTDVEPGEEVSQAAKDRCRRIADDIDLIVGDSRSAAWAEGEGGCSITLQPNDTMRYVSFKIDRDGKMSDITRIDEHNKLKISTAFTIRDSATWVMERKS